MFTINKDKPGGLWEMLVIAVPIMVSQSCDTLMVFTDRFFLSKLGGVHMNAAMSGGLSSFMMICFFTGLIGFSTALVGQYLGANRNAQCSKTVTQAFFVACAAYPLILLAKPLAYQMFSFMNLSDEQMLYQGPYFNILLYGSIIGLLRAVFYSYFSGIGRTRIIMTSTIAAMLVNVGVNYVIIFGRFGFPALGIEGAAYGTLLGGVVGLVILVVAYFKSKNYHEFYVNDSFVFDKMILSKLLKFGYPPGVETLLNIIAFNSIIMVFQAHNEVSAIAASITFSWDMVSFVPLIGIEIAVTSLVGRYMGAKQAHIAERCAMSALKVGMIFSSVVFIMFVVFPGVLVDVFRPQEFDPVFQEARSLSIFMIQVAAIYVTIQASVVTFIGVLRGAGDTFYAMVLSIVMHWTMAVSIYVALNYFNFTAQNAWLIAVGAFVIMGMMFYLRYRTGKWKSIRVLDDK